MLCDFIREAANVRPSKRQLDWYTHPFYAFVHFSPNTYTGREWGTGKEDPAIFNPTELDCDQWVEAVKSAGMTGLVLTAKHHDGFCLWPSKFTEHSVKNSPCKRDIVRETADACRRGGIRFGFYLSPWDRNFKQYGSDAYNDYYKAQLTELLTEYGEIFHVWFDGACGEGANGRKQEYDYPGYIDIIRKYQPNATIFNDKGPDVRWIGNESGVARAAEWAVVPSELCPLAEMQTGPGPMEGEVSLYNTDERPGDLSTILYSKGLCFCGAETDMSIRPGWFYHPQEEPHSLERLFKTYLTSVGGNSSFNLNIPPMPSGKFDPRDVKRLGELGDALRKAFGTKKEATVTRIPAPCGDTQCAYEIKTHGPIRYLNLSEDIAQGQRVESFKICKNGEKIFEGATIGNLRICPLSIGDQAEEMTLTVQITAARDKVENLRAEVF